MWPNCTIQPRRDFGLCPKQNSGVGEAAWPWTPAQRSSGPFCVCIEEDYYFTLRAIAASADIKHRFRAVAKACCVPIVVLLVIAALGPEKWAPRTDLGWQFDHFIGYFGITLFFCFAWPRPFVVGGVFMAVAALLEVLQAFTPDRSAYLPAVLYGAAGALAAALIAELVTRV